MNLAGRISNGGEAYLWLHGGTGEGLLYCRDKQVSALNTPEIKDMAVTVEWGDEVKTFTVTRVVGAYEPLEIADFSG